MTLPPYSTPIAAQRLTVVKPLFLAPSWPAVNGVAAKTTQRSGGVSLPPFTSFNLATHVGDNLAHVTANRSLLRDVMALPANPVWLNQTHSTKVVYLTRTQSSTPIDGDAVWTDQPGVVCSVLTADCLPILLARRDGKRVAAIHAGWRGAANGIIENTFACATKNEPNVEWQAWLGPAIGPEAFEVGDDVYAAFCDKRPALHPYFKLKPEKNKFLLDLPGLCAEILRELGVSHVSFSHQCTYSNPHDWYSYRRSASTGRQASLIWIIP